MTAAGIMSLQRSVGNAAVARMVEAERHEHGAGCGHEQAPAPVQRRSVAHEVLNSPGEVVAPSMKSEMEGRFGRKLPPARVHRGPLAERAAEELGAQAFTSQGHMVFGRGAWNKPTIAHEWRHVEQQLAGPVSGTDNGNGFNVSHRNDDFEKDAEAHSAQAMRAPVPSAPVASTEDEAVGTHAAGAGVVQRVATAAGTAQLDASYQAIDQFVTDILHQADKLISDTKGLRWRLRAKPDKQKHCDELGRALDTAEHMIYKEFRNDPQGKSANPKNDGLKALMDEIQKRHLTYVTILRANGLRPYAADIGPEDTHKLQGLSDTWGKVVGGQGIETSDMSTPFGDPRTRKELKGFGNQILSAHARLLSREHGRGVVTDLTSSPATAEVKPYHPEMVELMGASANTNLGAEAHPNSETGLASNENTPNTGSSSLVAVPHNFKDSEGAKEGESISPAFIVYGHELIHAQHNKHGINVRSLGKDEEEKATVSGTEKSDLLHARKGLPVTTEEMIRDEHGMPRRGGYT
jgi:hypothetical protein